MKQMGHSRDVRDMRELSPSQVSRKILNSRQGVNNINPVPSQSLLNSSLAKLSQSPIQLASHGSVQNLNNVTPGA